MKRALCWVTLLGVLTGLSGCFVWVRDCESSKPVEAPKPHCADSTLAEIDAAKTLGTDEAKLSLLMTIARRPLSPEARLGLIEAAKSLSTDEARQMLLMTLAQNPPVVPQPPLPPAQPQMPGHQAEPMPAPPAPNP